MNETNPKFYIFQYMYVLLEILIHYICYLKKYKLSAQFKLTRSRFRITRRPASNDKYCYIRTN